MLTLALRLWVRLIFSMSSTASDALPFSMRISTHETARAHTHTQTRTPGAGSEKQDWGGRRRGQEKQNFPRRVVDVMW